MYIGTDTNNAKGIGIERDYEPTNPAHGLIVARNTGTTANSHAIMELRG